MPNSAGARAAQFADQFEAAQDEFVRLVASLTDLQWRLVGRNYPSRFNDEDEGRPVGIIAHHVAISGPFILDRIQVMLEGRQLSPVDIGVVNAEHAAENAKVTREEVLRRLKESRTRIGQAVRAIPDDQLDQSRDTPVGPITVAERLERVLIGHIKAHQGSIEAALS